MPRRIHIAILALPLSVAVLLPTAADAGTYTVYSCKTPDGRAAAVDGWSHLQVGGQFSAPSNSCDAGGGLAGVLNGAYQQSPGDRIGWSFEVPAGLDLVGFRMWRSFIVRGQSESSATPVAFVSWPTSNFSPDAREMCVAAWDCSSSGAPGPQLRPHDVIEFDGLDPSVRSVYVLAGCGGNAPCAPRRANEPAAEATMKAFEGHLRDTSAPIASDVQGRLAAADVHSGVETLSYNASDAGSGVYRTVIEVQREGTDAWEPVSATPADPNDVDCSDANPADTDPYQFVRRIPCKPQFGGTVSVDTTKIPNGSHQLRVMVEDASGNRSTVLQLPTFRVSNRATTGLSGELLGAPSNGTGASNQIQIRISKALRRKARHLRYGQRYRLVATIRNELRRPVVGARVDVLQRIRLPGAGYRAARTPLTTGRRGQIRWTVPAGTSRRLLLAYKANLLNGSYQETTAIPLEVMAKTTLRRDRSSYRNGQTIHFRGQVRSKPIPKGGVLIDLQAYKRGSGWVTFATKRSGRRGKWRIDYRLSATTSTVRYKFRARVRQDTGYPYAAGRTKPVSVLVRP